MATLLFVIFRLAHLIVLPYPQSELLILCQLLAVDTVAVAIILHALLTRRAKKG
ncbi:MAG: hypothetical protein JSU81_05685 [Candidatus Coatesbacteria bacterium]|nr:MAG: hypothetical protein JSU81_05685 [Candidatus Coatesbacteria bacterium]